jgi:pyruvate-ferredoxin/flavodoxin oxidoreductase
MGAVAKFASGGRPSMKKDLGMMCMTYGNIYIASVAMGANPAQAVRAFAEAESYPGPSIIIAYSHCIAHGVNMRTAMQEQKEIVNSGHFFLYRFDPRLTEQGKNPLKLDSKEPTIQFSEQASHENRFRILNKTNPENAKKLLEEADKLTKARYDLYQKLAALEPASGNGQS